MAIGLCLTVSTLTVSTVRAQVSQTPGRLTSSSTLAPIPTLASLDQSTKSQNFTATELRRFFDSQGNATAVRERLEVAANGSAKPDFALTFLGVEGEAPGSPLNTTWQQTYSRFASQFVTQTSFRIRNLLAASANYTIHDFGPVVRANRSSRRMVVFPATLDKAIWLVDIDVQTHVPLYAAEFDPSLRLLSEVEVLTFANSVQPFVSMATAGISVPSYAAACTVMGNPGETVDPNLRVTADYSLDKVEVVNNPLNGQWKMTMTFTDGIDQFQVVEAPNASDWLAGMPAARTGNVIGRFRDPAMSVLVFWESGVLFHVAGRGALSRLDALAQSIYVQALTSH